MGAVNIHADYLSRSNNVMLSFFYLYPRLHPCPPCCHHPYFKLFQLTAQIGPHYTSGGSYHQGLAASTHKTYSVGIQNYLSFCEYMYTLTTTTRFRANSTVVYHALGAV